MRNNKPIHPPPCGRGLLGRRVKFKYPCRKLKIKDGDYYCSIYDDKELPRPHMCEEYPDNIPLALLDYEKEKCPALRRWSKMIYGDDDNDEDDY